MLPSTWPVHPYLSVFLIIPTSPTSSMPISIDANVDLQSVYPAKHLTVLSSLHSAEWYPFASAGEVSFAAPKSHHGQHMKAC